MTYSIIFCLVLFSFSQAYAVDVEATPADSKQVTLTKKQIEELVALNISKGAQLKVTNYLEKAGVFKVTIVEESAVGPNYVSPQELHKAMDSKLTLQAFVTNKKDVLGKTFTLKQDLPLVDENIVEKKLQAK